MTKQKSPHAARADKNVKKRVIIAFISCAVMLVGLVAGTLALIADSTLKSAAANCDTIKITARYNADTKTLSAAQVTEYKNRTGAALDNIKFHLYANAYRDGSKNPPVMTSEIIEAYPNGKSFGNIMIHKLAVNGAEITAQIESDDTVLNITPRQSIASGETVRIETDYTVQIANIKHRLGWTEDAVNLGNFYPVPCIFEKGAWQTFPYSASGDPFYNAMHNYEVSVTAPADFTVAASGSVIRTKENEGTKENGNTKKIGGTKTTELKSQAIRDFAMVLSQKFRILTKKEGATAVKYYYITDKNPEQSLKTAVKALKTFSRIFVKYPYPQLSVVQTDFLHGGMEYGELVYVSKDILEKHTAADGTPYSENEMHADHDRVIIHEIAHQWWYGIVGNNQTRSAWIDEGLAEYSTVLFYDNNPEYNIDRSLVINNARASYSSYIRLVHSVGGKLDITMNRDLMSFNSSYEYIYMTYVKGMLLFCDLETLLTRNAVGMALKNFASVSMFSIGTQDALVASIEKTTNAKVGVFFTSYTDGF